MRKPKQSAAFPILFLLGYFHKCLFPDYFEINACAGFGKVQLPFLELSNPSRTLCCTTSTGLKRSGRRCKCRPAWVTPLRLRSRGSVNAAFKPPPSACVVSCQSNQPRPSQTTRLHQEPGQQRGLWLRNHQCHGRYYWFDCHN